MVTAEQEAKKDIAGRLKLSDPKRWNSLSTLQQEQIVAEYFKIRSLDYENINLLLRDNANMRREVIFIIIGVVLGIVGNIIADIVIKLFPHSNTWELVNLGLLSVLLIFASIYALNKALAENLGEEKIIERLLKLVELPTKT